ncbi:MAG: DNA mismatch repair protein MutS, partial [Bradyrhizobiaceae bacterium]|nr:DNA mismatch repair protein MutS [Bradyrhizobiaceae bacterium]
MKPVAKPVSGRRLRALSPDEEDLWSRVARSVRPLRPMAAGAKAPQAATAERDAGKTAARQPTRATRKAAPEA